MPKRTLVVVWLAADFLLPFQAAGASECPAGDVVLVVDTAAHELKLCDKGVAVKAFRVALGSGGTGKTKAGDDKTPLGVYPLGSPRASARFGVFIAVGYPTKSRQQRASQGGTSESTGRPPLRFAR